MILKPLSELFTVKYGVNLELINLRECAKSNPNSINFVSRTESNNGISAYVLREPDVTPNPAMTISVAGGGSVLSTFLQKEEYYSGRDMYILLPKKDYSELELLYYVYCIRQNKYRYNYGRQANKTLKDLVVPAEIPASWSVKSIKELNTINREPVLNQHAELNTDSWKYFTLNDIFDIKKGKRLTKEDMTPGDTRFIGSSDANNGQTASIGEEPIHSGNTISVCYNGSVAEAFYQPEPYWATDDVNALYPKFNLNPYIGLFVATIIKREKYRYNYGRKWHLDRMRETKIMLPARGSSPDWKFMEDYIKSLPFSSTITHT